jgi:predicted HTH domain antitoxin
VSRHSGAGRLPAVRFLHVASQLNAGDLAKETAKLLALELFRQDKVSMGRAAELCYTPIEAFIEFAAEHEVPLHYGIADSKKTVTLWPTAAVTVVSDSSPLITLARIGWLDLLNKLYGAIYVSSEVYREVAIDDAGLPVSDPSRAQPGLK